MKIKFEKIYSLSRSLYKNVLIVSISRILLQNYARILDKFIYFKTTLSLDAYCFLRVENIIIKNSMRNMYDYFHCLYKYKRKNEIIIIVGKQN